MLTITKNTTNEIVTTLDSVIDTTIVFEFKQFQSKEVITIAIYLDDALINNVRFQSFEFDETNSNKFKDGYYDYTIYGHTGTLTYVDEDETIIDTNGMSQLEIGKLYVYPTVDSATYYNDNKITIVYE